VEKWHMGHGKKKPLDFGGNWDQVTITVREGLQLAEVLTYSAW